MSSTSIVSDQFIDKVSLDSFAFLQVKAFGDLVIAAASLRTLPVLDRSRCRLVVCPYLKILAEVLAVGCEIEVLDTADAIVPAAFNLKQAGLLQGITSLISLRTAVKRIKPQSTIVMPSVGFRERFIIGKHSYHEIPSADNVYLGYQKFIDKSFPSLVTSLSPTLAKKTVRSSRVLICPYSRVYSKNLPSQVVIELAAVCDEAGLDSEILLLEGECFEHPNSPFKRVIPRQFDALSAALSDCAAVISADSLPAHLAEYCGTPTFVVSPIENCYWFPRSVFLGDHWGVFFDKSISARLRHFLDMI
jgi:hypothetical protein